MWLLRRLTAGRPSASWSAPDAPEVCVGLIVLGVTAYAVLGGADFGAGFWDLTAGGDARGGRVRGLIQRSMSPVWEANHVWLIFLLVVSWTAFPVAFGVDLLDAVVPLFLAALGIILRGTAFALRGQAATIGEARMLGAVFALSSVLVPFFLGAALGGIASGRVPIGNAEGDLDRLVDSTRPRSRSARSGVLTGAYLAAVYLAADSRARRAARPRRRLPGPRARRRGRDRRGRDRQPARRCAPTPGRCSTGSRPAAGWPRCSPRPSRAGSTLVLVWTRRYEVARFTAAAAVAARPVGWALAPGPVPAAGRADARRGRGARRDAHRARGRGGLGLRDPRPVAAATSTGSSSAARSTRPTSRSTSASGGDRVDPRARRVFAAGSLLLFLFESWVTRALGVVLLFAAVVLGVFAIATPEALGGEEDG